jgi:putative phosphoesterase
MTKIAIFTDVHANWPALETALQAIAPMHCDVLVHVGDAISIGPYPAETLECLLQTPNLRLVMGNHDAVFVFGIPRPRPTWMSEGELAHEQWVHAQLRPEWQEQVAQWPFALTETFDGVTVTFLHYALDEMGRHFAPIVKNPDAAALDTLFAPYPGDLIFYGHTHQLADLTGQRRYVNPGSLGCHTEAVARFVILECHEGQYQLTHHAVPYDDAPLAAAFQERNVPDREFIWQAFFGGREVVPR